MRTEFGGGAAVEDHVETPQQFDWRAIRLSPGSAILQQSLQKRPVLDVLFASALL